MWQWSRCKLGVCILAGYRMVTDDKLLIFGSFGTAHTQKNLNALTWHDYANIRMKSYHPELCVLKGNWCHRTLLRPTDGSKACCSFAHLVVGILLSLLSLPASFSRRWHWAALQAQQQWLCELMKCCMRVRNSYSFLPTSNAVDPTKLYAVSATMRQLHSSALA